MSESDSEDSEAANELRASLLMHALDDDSADADLHVHQQQQQQQQQQQNNVAGGNKSTVGGLLEYSLTTGLLNKLHANGLQLRGLPQEFTPSCITSILLTVKPILAAEPSCLEITSPVVLFGDLHGEFHLLAKLTDLLGRPPARSYLYLGDYVDRGQHSLETMLYLLLMKSTNPSNVFVLRGNHEDRRVYRFFNFEDDLVKMFGLTQGQNLSSLFNTVLAYLPVCAIINGEIFCCHGGLSPHFNHPKFANTQKDLVRRINELAKPVLFRKSDFVADLLWADPLDTHGSRMPNLQTAGYTIEEWMDKRLQIVASDPSSGRSRSKRGGKSKASSPAAASEGEESKSSNIIDWMPNPRGCSYVFSKTAFAEFSNRYRIRWLVRAHMFVASGLRECFKGGCVTLFSAADYAQKFHNTGAIMAIDGASKGEVFPGRVMRYAKQTVLKFSGPLPSESANWPLEMIGKPK